MKEEKKQENFHDDSSKREDPSKGGMRYSEQGSNVLREVQ